VAWLVEHGLAVLVCIASVLLVLLGGIGGTSPGDLSESAAHHYAHIALPTLAFVIFSCGVARDVRRHGWPSFSLRL
jgi:hypothetical protein